jgi:hypothetical protein
MPCYTFLRIHRCLKSSNHSREQCLSPSAKCHRKWLEAESPKLRLSAESIATSCYSGNKSLLG